MTGWDPAGSSLWWLDDDPSVSSTWMRSGHVGDRPPGCKGAPWSRQCPRRRMGARCRTWLMGAIHRGSSVWS